VRDPIRVVLVDDHAVVREGLRALLSSAADIEVVGEANNGRTAIRVAAQLQPDVVMMDLKMPEMGGLEAIGQIRSAAPKTNIVILTSFIEESQVRAAIEAGALGYLLKDAMRDDIVSAIHAASQGRPALHPEAQRHLMKQLTAPASPSLFDVLTPRERDVLRLVAEGNSNKRIASALQLTEGTVKGHVSSILVKLGVEDRTQAAVLATRNGFLEK
jgi:DNA-binding NarL/FixJ family response regulator